MEQKELETQIYAEIEKLRELNRQKLVQRRFQNPTSFDLKQYLGFGIFALIGFLILTLVIIVFLR